jgi:hypothetical protein
MSVSLAFEKGQDGAELFVKVEEKFSIRMRSRPAARGRGNFSHGTRSGFGAYARALAARSVALCQMLARSGDSEPLFVQQALDFENGLNVLASVQALAGGAFHWLKSGKFGFPEAQDERFRAGETAYFADAEKALVRNIRCRLCCACHVSFAPYLFGILGGFRAMSTPGKP